MSKFAILKTTRIGQWCASGEITVNVDLVAAIESEPGSGGQCTNITLSGGRVVCVMGDHKEIRRALVRQSIGEEKRPSAFEQMFGGQAFRDLFGSPRRGLL